LSGNVLQKYLAAALASLPINTVSPKRLPLNCLSGPLCHLRFGAKVYVFWGGREATESDASKNAVDAIASRGLQYERLDQLTVDALLGTRGWL
jgi:hypothetical protein